MMHAQQNLMPTGIVHSETERITIVNAQQLSNFIRFNREYSYFKISPTTITGFAASDVLTLKTISKLPVDPFTEVARTVIGSGGAPIAFTWTVAIGEFVWTVGPITPLDSIALHLSTTAGADIIFQVTGYDPAL